MPDTTLAVRDTNNEPMAVGGPGGGGPKNSPGTPSRPSAVSGPPARRHDASTATYSWGRPHEGRLFLGGWGSPATTSSSGEHHLFASPETTL